ncbi:MAG: tetratricopeptide repeat protein, partial [Pseudonocardiaceae bacterium]
LDLLTLAAHLAPEPIPFNRFTAHADLLPEPLATTAEDPLAFASLTRLLRQRALARISTDGMQLHRLVQAILLSRQAGGATRDDMAAVALRLLRETVPADPWNDPTTWPAWRQLLPHVLTVTSRDSEPTNEDVAWLLGRAASYLQTLGSPRLARPLSERAFELHQQLRGKDQPDTLASANDLAVVLHALGEHQQARQLDEDTLTRSRRILGEDHPTTLDSAHNLAYDLHALGEHQQARQLDEDTLIRRRRILGEDHPDTLGSADNLAVSLHALGEHEQARQLEEYVRAHRKG